MIGPVPRYPTNPVGTDLSPVVLLEGVFVPRENGGKSRFKGTVDYGKTLYQTIGTTDSSMSWKGCFSFDLEHEWQEIVLRQEIRFIELIIKEPTYHLWTISVEDAINYGRSEKTDNGLRWLVPMQCWLRIDY